MDSEQVKVSPSEKTKLYLTKKTVGDRNKAEKNEEEEDYNSDNR